MEGYALIVGQWQSNLVESGGVEDAQSLCHLDKVGRIVEVDERLAERRSLDTKLESGRIHSSTRMGLTLRSFFCQKTSNSLPAASMHPSTAATSSLRIDRMFSSALGLFLSNSSDASKSRAAGDAEPGRKTSCDDSEGRSVNGSSDRD